MSAPSAPGGAVQAAIARAALATGIDFQYLMAQASLESNFDPAARAATSSAAGLFQFTKGTWLGTLGRHAADHGMAWVQQLVSGGGLADPGLRARIMDLRYDAQASALMAAELANDNRAELTARLGREPDATELYLAHFLGAAGAGEFLSALAADPLRAASSILPAAAAANPLIFYQGGAPRSLGGVMDLMRSKMAGAMERAASSDHAYRSRSGEDPIGPVAHEFRAAARSSPQVVAAPPRHSMAETLRGLYDAGGTGGPAHVRKAYARLAELGL